MQQWVVSTLLPTEELLQNLQLQQRNPTEPDTKPGNLACKPDDLKAISAQECQKRTKIPDTCCPRSEYRTSEIRSRIPIRYISFAEVNKAWETEDNDQSGSDCEEMERYCNRDTGYF